MHTLTYKLLNKQSQKKLDTFQHNTFGFTYIETLQADARAVSAVRACRQAHPPRRGTSWHPTWSTPALYRCVRRTDATPRNNPKPSYHWLHAIGRRLSNDNNHHAPRPIPPIGPPSDRLQENSRSSENDIERFTLQVLVDKWTQLLCFYILFFNISTEIYYKFLFLWLKITRNCLHTVSYKHVCLSKFKNIFYTRIIH